MAFGSSLHQGLREYGGVFLRGMAMGAADVVPGVSGGTIAFITGIYDRLLNALKSLTPFALIILKRDGMAAFWRSIDGTFLAVLFAGVLVSVLSLVNLITYSLTYYTVLVWSFFSGLVLASALYLCRQNTQWRWQEYVALLLGTALAVFIVSLRPAQMPAEWWMLMLAGAIAICAMILPGISGSFMMLLMGMYEIFIEALQNLNIGLLASFGLGCIIGLLTFSHLLSWLLLRYRSVIYALLTGFLLGSLKVLWPWKQVVETTIDRHGDVIPLVQANVWPNDYTRMYDEPNLLLLAIVFAVLGLITVLLIERFGSVDKL